MNGATSKSVVRRVAAALTLLTAPLVAVEQANAQVPLPNSCSPATSTATPANNTTVTCSGTTTDQNADNVTTFAGYGTGTETAIIVNVGDATTPASVTASSNVPASTGIFIHDGTVNNFGTVTVAGIHGAGIKVFGDTIVNNFGGINFDTTGHGDIGIRVSGNGNVTNAATGIIFGNLFGVLDLATANITNAGIIQAGAPNGIAINAATVNITNDTGFITAVAPGGTAIKAAGDATVTNAVSGGSIGNILSTLFGIDATNANVTNSGVIGAPNAGGTAIHATGTATVSNTGDGINTGIISGSAFGIDAGTVIVQSNTGLIEANDLNFSNAIHAVTDANVTNSGTVQANSDGGTAILASTTTVTNSGKIQALGNLGAAIRAVAGDATVTNTVNGSSIGQILGSVIGIDATNANITNSGVISAGNAIRATGTATVSNTGDGVTTGIIAGGLFGIDAGTVVVTANTGLIEAGLPTGNAIHAATDVTVTSNAGKILANSNLGVAIKSDGTATVHNSGTISANGLNGVAISGSGDVNVDNSNSIQATGQGGTAITSVLSKATVNNSSTGTITAERFAIVGINADITNAGVIEATGSLTSPAVAIEAATGAQVNNSGRISALNTNGSNVGIFGHDTNVVNSGTIEAPGTNSIGIQAVGGTATVTNNLGGSITGGAFGIQAATLAVTNTGGTISGGTAGITGSGTVTNAGTIKGTGTGANSVLFNGTGINTLTLQTGSTLIGDAVGSTAAGAINKLILQGQGGASSNFKSFDTLDVNASGVWNLGAIGGTSTIGVTAINSGTLEVNSTLISQVTVNSGGALAGLGIVSGDVAVASGGAVAPGASFPFKTLNVSGNVNFQTGSLFRVNANAARENDSLAVGGTATLTGGTVNVLASGTFAPSTSTKYTILTAAGGGLGPANNNTFSSVTSNLAFLTPTLTYDPNDVFLTLATNGGATGGTGFGFATAAQTRNQQAIAGALDASPASNPLVIAVLNQTADGARQAFDALSGEVFGSVQTTQAGQTQFARSAMLGRMRQASYSGAPGELVALAFGGPELAYASGDANGFPVKAPGKAPFMNDRSRDLTFWAQGLGGWGHTDSDGNAASVSSRFGGFLSGVDARYGDTLRAGLVAGFLRSDLNAAARSSSAGIDSVQLGAYAGGRLGALNVRGGASYSYDSIDTSRAIAFPGFTDQTQAHFHGNVGQVFGEVGYGLTFGSVAVEPLAGLAYVHLHNGAFLESGGVAALSGSSVNENIGYSSLGVRAATALPLTNGTVLVPRGSLQWQHAFGDVTPAAALAFQGTGAAFSVAGVPIARDTALIESGFDWRFSPQARLGAYYQGELAAHAQAHAFKGTFSWNF